MVVGYWIINMRHQNIQLIFEQRGNVATYIEINKEQFYFKQFTTGQLISELLKSSGLSL